MKKRFYFLFLPLILSMPTLAVPIPAPPSKGQAFIILNHQGKKLCVYPYESGWGLYPALDSIGSRECLNAPPMTYDVLGRIAAKINGSWWCLRAPDSASVQSSYDYVSFTPCITNDPYQYWLYRNGKLTMASSGYQLGEINWSLAVAKDPNKLYRFSLSMKDTNRWLTENAKASAGLIMQMPMYWRYNEKTYYLADNHYSHKAYYNSENGHIFYRTNSASIRCLRSKQVAYTPTADWDWTDWVDCNQNSGHRELKWTLTPIPLFQGRSNQTAFAGHDEDGNILRIGQTGSHWGIWYTIKKEKAPSYTSGSPLGIFLTDGNLQSYSRLQSANLRKVLQNCPAPGGTPTNTLTPRALPPTFAFTPQWMQRLYQIARTQGQSQLFPVGVCGACQAQVLEMLSELYQSPTAPSGSGILFDLEAGDILQSLRLRIGSVTAGMLEDDFQHALAYFSTSEHADEYSATRLQYSISAVGMIMPHFDIVSSQSWDIPSAASPWSTYYQPILNQLLQGSIGSTWLIDYDYSTGTNLTHSMLIIRMSDGVHFIPTVASASVSEGQYNQAVSMAVTDPDRLREGLLTRGFISPPQITHIHSVRLLELTQFNPLLMNTTLSVGQCQFHDPHTGGLGNGQRLTGDGVNQCGMRGEKCDKTNPTTR